jgi:nitroreductase
MSTSPIEIDQVLARQLVAAAVLAPSSHNTQPWRFRVHERRIDLLADVERALPVNDPVGRELAISCGAALFNLRLAAATADLECEVLPAPSALLPNRLASVVLHRGAVARPAWDGLYAAIADRRTWRRAFADREVERPLLARLMAAAADQGAWLAVVEGDARRAALAALVAEADAVQWSDAAWRAELAAWMHPRRRGDGLAMPWLAAPIAQRVVRSFDLGKGIAARDHELAAGSPVLAVLGTRDDTRASWIAAGQALQQVLLTAAVDGAQASYLNQPVEVPALRARVAELAGHAGEAQLVLRLGYADAALPAAPRRPLDDVLDIV